MASVEQVRKLINGAVRSPEEVLRGATDDDLAALRARIGRQIPAQLAELLIIYNGAGIGPGGLFGQGPKQPHLDLPTCIDLFPEWTAKGWLPVAGDGCGNYFVLLTDGRVGFADTTGDPSSLAGTPHEDLFTFVESVLISDQEQR